MTKILSIADSPPALVQVGATVVEAVQAMAEHKVGAAVVVDGDELRGIFTERDVMMRVVREGLDPAKTTVSQVMTPNAECMCADTELCDAISLMLERRFRHLPVCKDGKVVGILSSRHLLRNEVQRLFVELDSLEAFLTADGPGG